MAAGKRITPTLTPWGSFGAAKLSFNHAVLIYTRLAAARGNLGLDVPRDWEDAALNLATILDEAASLPAPGTASTHAPAQPPPPPADAAAIATLLKPALEGLGSGIRKLNKKDTHEFIPTVAKTGAACAALVLRPLADEAVITAEAALGAATERGETALSEAARICGAGGERGRAAKAFFASNASTAERVGALPSNLYDAWLAARAAVHKIVEAEVTGPLSRPDLYTAERAADVKEVVAQFFEGRIDLTLLTKVRGGVEPNKKRSLANQDGARPGDPSSLADVRDAVAKLVDIACDWWRDVLGIPAGPDKDFGIKSVLNANKRLDMAALTLTMKTGFGYTASAFKRFREDPRAPLPDVLGAWADAQRYDAEPLDTLQQIAVSGKKAAREEFDVLKKSLESQFNKLQRDHSQSSDTIKALTAKLAAAEAAAKRAGGEGEPKNKKVRLDLSEVGEHNLAADKTDAKAEGKAVRLDGTQALAQIGRDALQRVKPQGDWPCVPLLLSTDDKCPHGGKEGGCRSCAKAGGFGVQLTRDTCLGAMRAALDSQKTTFKSGEVKAALIQALKRAEGRKKQ